MDEAISYSPKNNKINCWHVWKRYVFFCIYCLCYVEDIYIHICQRTRCRKIEIPTWMRRRISYWIQLGKSIGRMLLRKVTIRRIFVPCGGRYT